MYIDDHIGAVKTFYVMYAFLNDSYFSRVVFGPVYLLEKKTKVFMDTLEFLGFEKSRGRLRPLAKHQNKIEQMPVPTLQEEFDVFLWLIPFLQIFIPGQVGLVMKLKKTYLRQVLAPPKEFKEHNKEVEECYLDLTKPATKKKQLPKTLVRKVYIEREVFIWGLKQEKAFNAIKTAILNNAVAGANPDL